jgi:hypothetical protein
LFGTFKKEQKQMVKEGREREVKCVHIEQTIGEIVDAARHYKCCSKRCLSYIYPDIKEGDRILTEYMTHWFNMSPAEHRQQFLAVLEGCVHGVTVGGHVQKK